MSAKYLGTLFDIHCGGEDHIAVHHTNEIAQTEAAYGTRLANYWLHGFFLQLGEEKMAKSSGEFLQLRLLVDKGYDPLAYRYFCLGGHYRTQLKFSWESLTAAQKALENLRAEVGRLVLAAGGGEEPEGPAAAAWREKFKAAVNDDLNMPQALAVLWDLLKDDAATAGDRLSLVREFDAVLGLRLIDLPSGNEIPPALAALLERRKQARAGKQWAESDRLRDEMAAHGYIVEDGPGGQRLRKKRFGE